MKSILVLGATGNVGNEIFKKLLNEGYDIIGTTKTIDKVEDKIVFLEIDNNGKLYEYISNFDIVINCIGPSYKYKNKIISISNELGKDYIDIYGGHILEKYLEESVNNVSIINAGCEPGITGILLKKFRHYFTNDDARINILSGGYELGGYAAFADIILSSVNGYNKNDYYIRDGDILRENFKNIIKLKNREGVKCNYRLYLTKEIERFVINYNVKNISSYRMTNKKVDEIVRNACIELIKLGNLEKIGNVEDIIYEAYIKIKKILFKGEFCIKTELFIQNRLQENIELSCKNTSSLIAVLILFLVKKLCKNEIMKGGYWAFEILDYGEFIDELLKINNIVQISF